MLSEADLSITKESFTLAMKTKETETDRVQKRVLTLGLPHFRPLGLRQN